jgi:hypothetical protein
MTMAYLRPNSFERNVFNKIAMRFGLSGTKTLEVKGHRSGEPQRVPVIPIERDGALYVISTRGESAWVRNLRATGEARLDGRPVRGTELGVAERTPVIEAYRPVAGRAVATYWKKLPDPKDHPVFRLEPA